VTIKFTPTPINSG